MKATELMIGDWVLYGQRFAIIKELYNGNVTILCSINGQNEYVIETYDNIEPIPLTAEILEKNGFIANKHVYPYPYYEYINEEDKLKVGFAFPQGNRTSYKKPWIYIDSENCFIEHLPCIFVHQLQQILILSRIEKEIVL